MVDVEEDEEDGADCVDEGAEHERGVGFEQVLGDDWKCGWVFVAF